MATDVTTATDKPPASIKAPPSIDFAHFRRVLGHFPTGVVVITAIADGEPVGFAVGSFASVSLDPPMVGFFPGKSSTSWPLIQRAGSFVVNVLGDHQQDLCRAFASSGGDKFKGIRWHRASNGAPVLQDVIAWIECDINTVSDAGDHWFVLSRVHDLAVSTSTEGPLLFFQGRYARVDAAVRT
ncbi:flavin reductase family protein [Streptomyces sp. NRRL S-31]|uniref:flavin reductase family protein n=1 Tax=Streptomyces sp. NRRL S-31 TaxID=1463898 RepID=UPI0009A11F07|nr:flavin reductase family protein [Streptomyces sp. NRRL S-31]